MGGERGSVWRRRATAGASGSGDDEHFEGTRTVHALDPIQLDIRGRRRAGDEGDRAPLVLYRLFELGGSFEDQAHDLILPDHAQVVVGQQRQRPAALSPPGVEDDGAGLGYAQGAPCQHAVALVEFLVGDPGSGCIAQSVDAFRDPLPREVRGDYEAFHAATLQGLFYCVGQLVLLYAEYRGLVLGHPLREALDDLLARGFVLAKVAALDACVLGPFVGARGVADAPEDGLFRVRHQEVSRFIFHHSRKVWSGTGLRSRTSVQPASLPGRRWIAPLRASGPCPRRLRSEKILATSCIAAFSGSSIELGPVVSWRRRTTLPRRWIRTSGMLILTGH